ncbi:GATA transcription factor 29 [Cardamine amara subsp. amara]|uniref:GATA transcription factor 29 n=1 Tax=Cardamine amara subsp. amara TaxID=228776 RepID=A0ABD0ZSE3_CARAN
MENEKLDLTLRLGLPNPIVDTRLSLTTPANTAQGTKVVRGSGDNNDFGDFLSLGLNRSGNDAGTCNYVGANIRVYSYVYTHFAGTVETLNFAPYAMAPSPVTPHVSHLNSSPNAAGTSGSGGSSEEVRRCTNRNCNAVNTPLWRRGPLGPKSLCNACGIKFMKEEKRRNERN